jgi:hypothetical protein
MRSMRPGRMLSTRLFTGEDGSLERRAFRTWLRRFGADLADVDVVNAVDEVDPERALRFGLVDAAVDPDDSERRLRGFRVAGGPSLDDIFSPALLLLRWLTGGENA